MPSNSKLPKKNAHRASHGPAIILLFRRPGRLVKFLRSTTLVVIVLVMLVLESNCVNSGRNVAILLVLKP